jgi:hypothetical protein
MSTQLPTQLCAHVDNAPSSLKAARYPQAPNCVDNCFDESQTQHQKTSRIISSTQTDITYLSGNTVQTNRATSNSFLRIFIRICLAV